MNKLCSWRNCSSQPSLAELLYLSLFVCPAMVTLTLSAATLSYFHYTNHIFSQRISHWQHHTSGFQCFQSQCSKSSSVKFIFFLQTFSSTPSLFFFSSTKKLIFLNQIFSSLLFRLLCKKYTFLLQIFSFFSFLVFLLLCKTYVFLLQIFKCQTFLCQPEMSTDELYVSPVQYFIAGKAKVSM